MENFPILNNTLTIYLSKQTKVRQILTLKYKESIILTIVFFFFVSCTHKKPHYTLAYKSVTHIESRTNLYFGMTADSCAMWRDVSERILVENLPLDSIAITRMMIDYVDSVTNGFKPESKSPYLEYYRITFYKSTFGIRRYFKNLSNNVRYRNSELPTAIGRDYVGAITFLRNIQERSEWNIKIDRPNGTFDEMGLARTDDYYLEKTHDSINIGTMLDESDEVLKYYKKTKFKE